jgi:transcriptional regulator with XRE-family HTH domain
MHAAPCQRVEVADAVVESGSKRAVELTPDKSSGPTRLAAVRRARGITQQEMAAVVGTSASTYWRLEHGRLSDPPLGLLVNCALALDVPLERVMEPEQLRWRVLDQRRPQPPTPADFRQFRPLEDE